MSTPYEKHGSAKLQLDGDGHEGEKDTTDYGTLAMRRDPL